MTKVRTKATANRSIKAKVKFGVKGAVKGAMKGAAVKEEFSRYDTADYLKTEADIAAYLTACVEDGDPALLIAALGDVARARNITQLAEKTGLTRMGLYKALSGQGNPSFATVSKVIHALGLKITVTAG